LAERLPTAEVLLLQGVFLERRPPGVDGPQVGLVVHQPLQAGRQPFHPGHRRPVYFAHVDLGVPPVSGEVGIVGGHKLPEVAVGRQEEDGVELLADAERAPDADAEEGEGDEKDGRLEEPGGEAFGVDGHEEGAEVPALGRLVVFVGEAGQDAVPTRSYALLVQGQEGNKPGYLQVDIPVMSDSFDCDTVRKDMKNIGTFPKTFYLLRIFLKAFFKKVCTVVISNVAVASLLLSYC
jgi:hypothetical protein